MTLSSTEAEYLAVSKVAQEILFIAGVLKFIRVQISDPMIVHVDNIGAIYQSQTATTRNRTKHIDTRYHFVGEYVENGTFKVTIVRSVDNDADIFTKNLPTEVFNSKKHQATIMNGTCQDVGK